MSATVIRSEVGWTAQGEPTPDADLAEPHSAGARALPAAGRAARMLVTLQAL